MPVFALDREQSWLLPPALEELIPADHAVRFVAAFVDGLGRADWAELEVAAAGHARHLLVLAVATLWVVAVGSRVEDSMLCGVPPAHLRTPPPVAGPPPRTRLVSVFALGLSWLRPQLTRGQVWRRVWLAPEAWPDPPPGVRVTRVPGQQAAAMAARPVPVAA